MTKIFCSNKLKDFLGQKFFASNCDTTNLYGDWNAHLFYFDRRKNILLINNKSYYSLILEDIKKADFNNFDTLFFNRLTEQLLYDKVIKISHHLTSLPYVCKVSQVATKEKTTCYHCSDAVLQNNF